MPANSVAEFPEQPAVRSAALRTSILIAYITDICLDEADSEQWMRMRWGYGRNLRPFYVSCTCLINSSDQRAMNSVIADTATMHFILQRTAATDSSKKSTQQVRKYIAGSWAIRGVISSHLTSSDIVSVARFPPRARKVCRIRCLFCSQLSKSNGRFRHRCVNSEYDTCQRQWCDVSAPDVCRRTSMFLLH